MSNWAIIPSDSDIMHRSHKYIEKVRTSKGGWRYIYKQPKYKTNAKNKFGFEERKKMKEAEKATDAANEKKQEFLKSNELARQLREKTGNQDNKEALDRSKQRHDEINKSVRDAEIAENRAFEAYRSTPLGKIEASAKAGGQIIADFIKTFPQMAATKISFLINGSPHNTKIPYKADDSWLKGTPYSPPSVHKNPSYIPKTATNDMDKFMDDYNKKNNTNYTRKTPTSSNNFQFGLKPDKEKLNYYRNLKFKRR